GRVIRRGTLLGIAVCMAGARWVPGLAAAWQGRVATPLLMLLHRLTARAAFPILEPLAVAGLCLGLRRRRWLDVLLVTLGMAALLWYPAYWARPAENYPAPDAAALERLCVSLTHALDASPLRFNDPYDRAGTVAGLPDAAVKPARYPEWMRVLGISGLFSPWTGEAVVDGTADALLPFTCVHELQHLRGIADEGAANIAAYVACVEQGGMFADSARLWALRYALPMLRDRDPDAARRVLSRMDAALARLLVPAEASRGNMIARVLGLEARTTSYDQLVRWLCR
ncbi:MAG: DUF3810 family protein, partial [Clostridia bacterium]|nr:DUF3810 family protein [Clostridia bacterium]